jgi:hypothetical protein
MADRDRRPSREDGTGPEPRDPSSPKVRVSRVKTNVVAPIKAAVALRMAGKDSEAPTKAQETAEDERDTKPERPR